MALDPIALRDALEAFFAVPPGTTAGCAAQWADVLGAFAQDLTPSSSTVDAAAATLQAALTAAFDSGAAAAPFETALTTFATAVAGGMAPAFVGTPPPGPLGLAGLLAAPRDTHAQAAQDFANAFDLWFRTGTATPSGGGAPVPWS